MIYNVKFEKEWGVINITLVTIFNKKKIANIDFRY